MFISTGHRLRVVFFGTPEFAVLPLRALINSEHEVLAVVTQADKQGGRGRHLKSCPVKLEAQKEKLKILQPRKARDAGFIEELKSLNPSIIVVAAYGQILPPDIINLPVFGCINIHASLLPKYRGAAPINWTIINGDSKTGVTIILMDEGMDTGPVLLQEEVTIDDEDTAGSLSLKLSKAGANLLMRALKELEHNNAKPTSQVGDISYARLLKKTDGLIQWSKSAEDLHNFIRGMNPWPVAYSLLGDERIRILKSEVVEGRGEKGVIKKVTKSELLVGTGEGMLSILELQQAGKPVMSVKAFLQGRDIKEGMQFYEKPAN